MAIPNEKLQQVNEIDPSSLEEVIPPMALTITTQLLQEIEAKAAFSQQQLGIVRAQLASKQREKRMLELSSTELGALPGETPVYDGVGKMFMLTTTKDVKQRQSREGIAIQAEIDNLNKKLNYLETTFKNSREHMEALFKRGG